MKKIVCLSTTPWHAHPTRKQQVMSRIKDAEILYFDPPVTWLAPLKDKSLRLKLSEYKHGGERVADNITRCSLPPVLPFYNKYSSVNRVNGRLILARHIRKMMKQYGFNDAVLWIYHPSMTAVVDYIPYSALVYDCIDRHSGYPGHIDPRVVDGMEAELARKCDVVFATAQGLFDTLTRYQPNAYMIPNGCNYELFSTAADGLPCPEDVQEIVTSLLGFSGAIQHCIDTSLVAEAARRRPDWTFAFVGWALAGVDTSELAALPNVLLLGAKPGGEVPKYLARFDVCLNLFKSGDLAKDVSPLKFYEYLATGKPIVSTPQPVQVNDFADVVYIADGIDEFISQCSAALVESDASLKSKRMAYAKACSWDARVAEMRDRLAKHNILV